MKERVAQIGSLMAAALASACCWGPLVAAGLGVGGAGAAAAFAPFRAPLLAAAGALLAAAFYLVYRRPRAAACPPGEQCAPEPSRRAARVTLWMVAALTVALAAFPYYSAAWRSPPAPAGGASGARLVALEIGGMTCEGCASHVREALSRVPGVTSARVSLARREAMVTLAALAPSADSLVPAVERAGYTAKLR